MRFIYIRHGEPTYNPDDLTELGKLQAEKIAYYLSKYRVDLLFSSTSNRAIRTAVPTAKKFNMEINKLDFANEEYVWNSLTLNTTSGKVWLFQSQDTVRLFHTQEIMDLRFQWYKHPNFSNSRFESEIERIQNESDRFFASLGYLHLGNGKFKVLKESYDTVVMFAHQGFGFIFLSLLLNIPYPNFCTRFELGHAEITIIEFKNESGYSCPKIISLSNHSHLL